MSIYLDYAAATPLDEAVRAAMQPYFSDKFYNPSATYLAARAVRSDLDEARHTIAKNLGARPAEVVFTAGATEANNLAIQGIMRQHPEAELLISAIEHDSVLAPAKLFNSKLIPVDEHGIIILNKLSNFISDKTVLVSVMLINNELGTIQPVREITGLIGAVREDRRAKGNSLPLYLHTDAAQAGNYLDLHTSRLGVDLMSINGGKIYGPKQSGALYIKAGINLAPLIVGGGQEFGIRSGTENVAGAIGLAAALQAAQQNRLNEARRISELRHNFCEKIANLIPNSVINGSAKHIAPHVISITFPGHDNERLMMELDERGTQCAVGSACSASRDEPSHVLSAIGLNDLDARSTLRFSLGKFTTAEELEKTAQVLAEITAA